MNLEDLLLILNKLYRNSGIKKQQEIEIRILQNGKLEDLEVIYMSGDTIILGK